MNNTDLILTKEAELRQAQLTGDVTALEQLIDDELVFTALDGTVIGKRDDLSLHQSGRLKITKMEVADRHILDLGTVAVVNVLMEAEAKLDGATLNETLRYTRVWCEQPDGWRVIAGHMSIVPRNEAAA